MFIKKIYLLYTAVSDTQNDQIMPIRVKVELSQREE